ncbi:peptidoglycan editing factor PgeF [Candidatus Deianiraea vastatrix]|uniref:Purine nucleoside phosphorylase n=1 Tax=Candidatus Deianiraea vastatrix TaxID=2163644 RepID=A0A5B8XED5_9RICK|nr:peptidoglycan editing factor PgeF [Candidatus Deianiraea vastatrix]QED23678.1 Putative laccase domain protein [Candidatus Deianiraea vastatrix]
MKMFSSRILSECGIGHGFVGMEFEGGENINFSRGNDVLRARSYALLENEIGMEVLGLDQVHSSDILVVDDEARFSVSGNGYDISRLPKGDGIICTKRGFAIGIQTADCVPVLFTDKGKSVIAGVHSGWRGTFGGISQKMIGCLEDLGFRAGDLVAVLGPSIAQRDYEVDVDFREKFVGMDRASGVFFYPSEDGKYYFDNSGYIRSELERLGVGLIEDIGVNTYSEGSLYSYRGAKKGVKGDGTNVSFICLK